MTAAVRGNGALGVDARLVPDIQPFLPHYNF